jgi:hypothetical protein
VIVFAHERVDNVLRQQVVVQHDARADRKAVVSWLTVRSRTTAAARPAAVVGRVLEVLRHADRAGDHVAVRQHHALRPAGAARRVEDRHHVLSITRWAQVGAVVQHVGEGSGAFGGRDQGPHIAVAQDVLDLRGLQHRVHGDEHTARLRGPKHADDRLELLREEDCHPVVAFQSQGQQGSGEILRALNQRPVVQDGRLVDESDVCSAARGAVKREFVEQLAHRWACDYVNLGRLICVPGNATLTAQWHCRRAGDCQRCIQ